MVHKERPGCIAKGAVSHCALGSYGRISLPPKQPPHLQRPNPIPLQHIPRPENPDQAIAVRGGLGVLLQLLLRQIDNPYLGNAGGGVERQLDFLVFVEAGIGDFDEEVDVLRLRMSLSIIIFPKIQNSQVRLRLGVLAERNRVLDTDSVLVRKGGSQPIV